MSHDLIFMILLRCSLYSFCASFLNTAYRQQFRLSGQTSCFISERFLVQTWKTDIMIEIFCRLAQCFDTNAVVVPQTRTCLYGLFFNDIKTIYE